MALRYDQSSGRLELVLGGQQLKTILIALQDVLQCLHTSPVISDVLLNPDKFVKQLRAVFAQCEAEDNVGGNMVLLEIIRDTFPAMDIKEKRQSVGLLIGDITRCLSAEMPDEIYEQALSLLGSLWNDEHLREQIRPEFSTTILNSNDKRLISALKTIMTSSDPASLSSSSSSSHLHAALSGPGGSSSSSSFSSSARGVHSTKVQTFSSSSSSYWSDSDSSTTGGMAPIAQRKVAPPGDTSPKVLKLSFLPHSMTEQWLLAHNAEELSFALDEINSVYNALSVSVREKARADMPRALKQIIFNLSGEALSVLISGLRLMESIAECHVEAFIAELDALFPKLHRYLEDQREILRRSALRLSVALAARLPFQLTENFITSAVEHKSIFSDCALKLAGIALLNVSSAGGIQVHLSDGGGGSSPKQLTSQQVRAARIAKAAVGYLAVDQELAAKLSATGQEVEQTPRTEATYEVAHDVIAAALLVLCPHEADTETGIFPEALPQSFLSMLLLGSGQGLTRNVQNEVSLRASGLSFPSLVKDSDVSAQVHMLLAMRMGHETNKAMSGGLRDRADSMSSREGGGVGGLGGSGGRGSGGRGSDSRSASPAVEAVKSQQPSFLAGGPASPTMNRVKSKLFDAATELNKGCSTVTEQLDDGDEGAAAQAAAHGYAYVPSWSDDPEHAVLLQSHEWSNNPGSPITALSTPHTPGGSVDQSKLATLKRFGRKPGSRRAHSAEVTSSTALLSDLEPAPSTSDGVRGVAGGPLERLGGRGKQVGGDASEEDMGFSPKNATDAAIGNFLDDDERNQMMAAVKAKSTKPKRRPNASNASSSSNSSSAALAFESLTLRDASHPTATHPPSSSAPRVVHSPRGTAAGAASLPGAGGSVGSRYRSAMEPTIPSPAGARAGASRHQAAGASSAARDSASSAAVQGRDNGYQYQIGTPVKAMDLFSTLAPAAAELGDSPDDQSFPSTSPTAADAFGSPAKRRTARNRADQPSPQQQQQQGQGQQLGSPTDKDGRPSALKPESLEYLETEDLKPLPYATKELPRVIGALEVQDWPDVFYTINSARQLAVHHCVLLNGGGSLHALVHGLLRCADNLRSAVAKNAILALGDLFQGMERGMDAELPAVLAMLLKKCGETSIFLSEAAELAVQRMIEHSTAQRSLLGLLSGTDNRNPTLRGKVARYLHSLVLARASELKGARELEGLKIKLGKMIGDHTPEARASARDIARIMLEAGLVSRADLEIHVAPDQLAKALNPANNACSSSSPQRGLSASPKRVPANRRRVGSESGMGSSIESDGGEFAGGGGGRPSALLIPSYDHDGMAGAGDEQAGPISILSRGKLRSSSDSAAAGGGSGKAHAAASGGGTAAAPSRAKVAAAKRAMESNEDLLALPVLMTASSNPNWIERREALGAITDLVIKYATVLRDASKLDACVEKLLERLDDGSIKVQQHSLGCLQRVHKESPSILPSMQLFVVPAFLNAASSSNKQIGASALGVMMDILAAVPAQQVVQQLCQTALHDKERLRSLSLRLLADNMHKYCQQTDNPATSNIVRKHIFPTISQTIFAAGTKGDVRVAAAEALKALQHCCPMGESVWAWETDTNKQEELRRMVGGKN